MQAKSSHGFYMYGNYMTLCTGTELVVTIIEYVLEVLCAVCNNTRLIEKYTKRDPLFQSKDLRARRIETSFSNNLEKRIQ